MEKIYARTLNPEFYDYRFYDISEDDGNEVIIDGGRDFSDVDQKDYLKAIKKTIRDYNGWDYDYYYKGSIMNYLKDYLPKKENGKKLSPKEASIIKKALEAEKDNDIICECLSIITGKIYLMRGLRGCCQGDYIEAYYPVEDGIQKYLDYVEAWYFGTGTEIEIHDDEKDPECAEDITGWTFYTASWKTEDIKNEIRNQCGASDDVKVILYEYTGTKVVKIDQYKVAEQKNSWTKIQLFLSPI